MVVHAEARRFCARQLVCAHRHAVKCVVHHCLVGNRLLVAQQLEHCGLDADWASRLRGHLSVDLPRWFSVSTGTRTTSSPRFRRRAGSLGIREESSGRVRVFLVGALWFCSELFSLDPARVLRATAADFRTRSVQSHSRDAERTQLKTKGSTA